MQPTNSTARSTTSSTESVQALALPDLDDSNVRRTRGTASSTEPPRQASPTPSSTGVLGYMASSIQGLLGSTPGPMTGANVLPPAGVIVHDDTPYHATAPLSSPTFGRDPGDVASDTEHGNADQLGQRDPLPRRTARDDGEEYNGIPIPEEDMDYGDDEYFSDELELSELNLTPEALILELQQGRRIRDEHDKVLDPAVVIPAMRQLILDRRKNHRPESKEVRSVLLCRRTGTHLIVLHPRGSWVRYRESGRVYLASLGHQPLAGINISKAMVRHLRNTHVIVDGGARGSVAPTPDDLQHAPYVNRRPRSLLSSPRAVRWYEGGPTSTSHCDWTANEWDDHRAEIAQGLHPLLQAAPPSWPTTHHTTSSSVFQRDSALMRSPFVRGSSHPNGSG